MLTECVALKLVIVPVCIGVVTIGECDSVYDNGVIVPVCIGVVTMYKRKGDNETKVIVPVCIGVVTPLSLFLV